MARSGLQYRQAVRTLRQQSLRVQLLALGTVLLLVTAALTAATRSGDGRQVTATGAVSQPGATGAAASGGAPGATSGAGQAPVPVPGSPGVSPGAAAPGGAGLGPAPAGGSSAPVPGSVSGAVVNGATATPAPGASNTATTLAGPPVALTASDRGVTPTSIKIAFPYFDATAAFALTGSVFGGSENQPDFINAYVDDVNAHGGINGRKIDPIVQVFNPLDDNVMHALCVKWAQDDKVFGVVDSAGWFGPHQLCLAQDNDTPLVSQWTTVSDWTTRAKPYLWWAGPSADQDIDNLVLWAKERGKLGSKVGVVTTDRPSDQIALKQHLLPALQRAGVSPAAVETFTYDRGQAPTAATLAVQKMKGKVDILLPLLPFDSFAFWLNAAEHQEFYPHYLLSDYEQELVVAEALLGPQFPKSLQNAEGPTYVDLGRGVDESRYPKGYTPEQVRCVQIWQTKHKGEAISNVGEDMRWCDNIGVFVEAARRAGPTLTRLSWAAAMATITKRPAGMTTMLSFGPGVYAGAVQMKVVKNLTSGCTGDYKDDDDTCLVQTEGYAPIRHF
jgi:hypothetical protein